MVSVFLFRVRTPRVVFRDAPVCGVVKLRVFDEAVVAKKIVLELEGAARSSWEVGSKRLEGKDLVHLEKIVLAEPPYGAKDLILEPGDHEYAFNLRWPDTIECFPASCYGISFDKEMYKDTLREYDRHMAIQKGKAAKKKKRGGRRNRLGRQQVLKVSPGRHRHVGDFTAQECRMAGARDPGSPSRTGDLNAQQRLDGRIG